MYNNTNTYFGNPMYISVFFCGSFFISALPLLALSFPL